MELEKVFQQCKEQNDYTQLIAQIPYAKLLGISAYQAGDELIFRLEQRESNLGNPTLPAIHGGVLAGFMEHAASLYLMVMLDQPIIPKIIDYSIDYLRAGHYRDTHCDCRLIRQGRRVCNVAATAWQTKRDEPIASARAQFLLPE